MIVVTGATGNVGTSLVRALAAAGETVRAVARRPAEGSWTADLTSPETLRPALDGADALFLFTAGDRPRELVDVAKAGGVRRIVLFSSQGAGTRPDLYPQPVSFEQAVTDSGLDWTILRPGGFFTNAFAWAESVRTQRSITAPFGDIALPAIDPADIAAVAAVALRDGSHAGRTYTLTGPAALDAPIRFVEQSVDDARAELSRFMPPLLVTGTLGILGSPSPEEQQVSPHVEQVTGRAGGTFAAWATAHAAAFR